MVEGEEYYWRELSQGPFLSCQKFCLDKHVFVETKHVFCRDKHICRDKTRLLSRQTHICRDKHVLDATKLLSWQKSYFVDTCGSYRQWQRWTVWPWSPSNGPCVSIILIDFWQKRRKRWFQSVRSKYSMLHSKWMNCIRQPMSARRLALSEGKA